MLSGVGVPDLPGSGSGLGLSWHPAVGASGQKELIFAPTRPSRSVDSSREIDILTDLRHGFVCVTQGVRSAEPLTL